MRIVKHLCQEVANTPHVLTFPEIFQAAAKGVAAGRNVNPALSALMGVSIVAGERAALLSKLMLHDMVRQSEQAQQSAKQGIKYRIKDDGQDENATKPRIKSKPRP